MKVPSSDLYQSRKRSDPQHFHVVSTPCAGCNCRPDHLRANPSHFRYVVARILVPVQEPRHVLRCRSLLLLGAGSGPRHRWKGLPISTRLSFLVPDQDVGMKRASLLRLSGENKEHATHVSRS